MYAIRSYYGEGEQLAQGPDHHELLAVLRGYGLLSPVATRTLISRYLRSSEMPTTPSPLLASSYNFV